MNHYEIAGLRVSMAVSGLTRKQAAAYAAPAVGEPDIILPDISDWVLSKYPQLGDLDTAQYVGTGVSFARALIEHDGFQLHASSVILDGKAYLFSAYSGTGKSTHTEKWVRLFGARYLNDDKPALRLIDGIWTAFGTPWSGKHDISSPEGAPVGAVVFLERGEVNRILPVEPAKAVPLLFAQITRAHPRAHTERMLELADGFLRSVPVWRLACRNDDEAAYVCRNAIV